MFSFSKKNASDRKETTGEKLFDLGVYQGINFAVNEALSMVIAVELRHFGGKAHFDKATHWWMEKRGFKDIVKNGVKTSAFTQAGDSLEVFTLLGGGTALVVPMKLLEDNKQKCVKNLNHLLDALSGNKLDASAVKARDEDVDKAIACEPKQTWGSMIMGRVVATVNNMFIIKETVFRGDRTQKTKDWSEKYMRIGADKLHQAMGGKPDSAILKIRDSERFKRYSEILGLETAYTAISSLVMEISSKFFARNKPEPRQPERCEEGKQERTAAQMQPQAEPEKADGASFSSKVEPRKKEMTQAFASHQQKLADSQTQGAQQAL